jgi:hypothetical protein
VIQFFFFRQDRPQNLLNGLFAASGQEAKSGVMTKPPGRKTDRLPLEW